jgi:hypothetical protein
VVFSRLTHSSRCCLFACRTYLANREAAVDFLNVLPRIYVVDGFACWEPYVSKPLQPHQCHQLCGHCGIHCAEIPLLYITHQELDNHCSCQVNRSGLRLTEKCLVGAFYNVNQAEFKLRLGCCSCCCCCKMNSLCAFARVCYWGGGIWHRVTALLVVHLLPNAGIVLNDELHTAMCMPLLDCNNNGYVYAAGGMWVRCGQTVKPVSSLWQDCETLNPDRL